MHALTHGDCAICEKQNSLIQLHGDNGGPQDYLADGKRENRPARAFIKDAPHGETAAPEFSEDALALHFADWHSNEFRYVASWGKWLDWTGAHWKIENTLAVFDLTRKICREAGAISAKKEGKK